jgi:uncharacterized membrane protein YdjX (TVP38/TMEM64 family)
LIKGKKKILLLVAVVTIIIALRFTQAGSILTFENLKQNRDLLTSFVQANYGLSVLIFVSLYITITAVSIPGAAILTLGAGFLFGTVAATVLVNVGATIGAMLAFLSSRYLIGERLQERYHDRMQAFNEELSRNGPRYLLTLRFIPVIPFFLINVLSGLTAIPIRTFLWTTSIGILPGTIVYAYAGSQIGNIAKLSEILTIKIILAFVLLALLAIFPVVLDRIRRARKK